MTEHEAKKDEHRTGSPSRMRKLVILDTNVLLADPNSVLSFPHAEVIIPETVLGELDKLKTARVDPDLRFRGREVSRLLFEMSQDGSLIDGVDLPDGGRLRVVPFDSDVNIPDGLSTRNADDRILATAYQVCSMNRECDVTIVTNDLNMLLKAQTLGLNVVRHGEGAEGSFARRYIIKPFQRYRTPLTILAIALAVFAAVIVIAVYSRQTSSPGTSETELSPEFKALLTAEQVTAYETLQRLQDHSKDAESLLAMANLYYSLAEQARLENDQASAIRYAEPGIRYFERYLAESSKDNTARADLASLLFYSGQTDRAIQQVGDVLRDEPNHVNANYNLGIILYGGRRDSEGARKQFEKVVELTEGKQEYHAVYSQAKTMLELIESESAQTTSTTGATQ